MEKSVESVYLRLCDFAAAFVMPTRVVHGYRGEKWLTVAIKTLKATPGLQIPPLRR